MQPLTRFAASFAPFAAPLATLLAVGTLSGCHTHVAADTKVVAERSREPSSAEVVHGALEQRLAAVEAKIDTTTDEAERRALARQRLVLTIAIVEVGKRIGAGETDAPDVDRLLISVERSLAGRSQPDRSRSFGGKANAERKPGRQGLRRETPPVEEEEADPVDVKQDKKSRGTTTVKGVTTGKECAPGDPLCGPPPHQTAASPKPIEALDEYGGEGDGRIEKARVEGESRPQGLMTAVHQRLGAMESCLGEVDDVITLQVILRMDAAGAVRDAKVSGVNPGVASCVAGVLKRVRVPDHDGGTHVVRFPLYFQPQ